MDISPEGAANLTTITFSYSADPANYMKAYCINPSSTECPFLRPCPNNDVTGIGQQISIYITTIIYGFVIAYIPWLHRPMLYAHLSVLYSLQIAALISIVKGELTNSDGIFVIVMIASPPSLYLWFYTIKSFIAGAHHFPIEHGNRNVPANKSMEVHVTRGVTLLALIFTVVMIALIFTPSIPGIKFPQRSCNSDFGDSGLWVNVVWQLPVAIQTITMILLYFMAYGATLLWTRRAAYSMPPPLFSMTKDASEVELSRFDNEKPDSSSSMRSDNIDLISWTEKIMFDQYPGLMNRTLFIALITNLQLSALPTFEKQVMSKDCLAVLILGYGLLAEGKGTWKVWVARVWALLFLMTIFVIRMPYLIEQGYLPVGCVFIPSAAAFLFFFVACTTAKWSWNNFHGTNMRVFLPILNVIFGIVIPVANVFIVLIADPRSFVDPEYEDSKNSETLFSLNYLTLVLWIISWLSSSAWPWKRSLTWDKLNKGLWKRAHILKVCWIIVAPHILWVQASDGTNIARPMEMTFGQIFAIIVSAVTLITLLDEAKDVKKDIWLSFLKSDVMYYEEVEQPKHYAVRAGMGMS